LKLRKNVEGKRPKADGKMQSVKSKI